MTNACGPGWAALPRGDRERQPGVALGVMPEVSSGTAALVARVVRLGWYAGRRRPVAVVPDPVAMNPATAVGFMLAGLSLGLSAATPAAGWRRDLARALGFSVAAIGQGGE